MEFQYAIGVDVSKEWLNFCVQDERFAILYEGECDNTPQAIEQFLDQMHQECSAINQQNTVLIMEYTGLYVKHLAKVYLARGGQLSMVAAEKISERLGGAPTPVEKTDQLDARRLAEYAHRHSDQLKPWALENQTLVLLQQLQRLRSRLIDNINRLKVPAAEIQRFGDPQHSQLIQQAQLRSLIALKKDLKDLEQQIQQLIDQDAQLSLLFQQITSVEGIGPVTAREILITTNAFCDFAPHQAKAFARFAGVVPLRKQSGKKKHKARIRKGNKQLKALLTMAATSLIRPTMNSEIGHYYQRKIAEGKPHRVVINAIRNKLILRVFAVVRNQVMYQKNLNLNLVTS